MVEPSVPSADDTMTSGFADAIRPIRNRHRTGIVGLSSSGKTTFLVTLLDRLWRLDGTSERRWGMPFMRHLQQLRPLDEEEGGFPYQRYREYYRVQQWPDKSTDGSTYRYRFFRSGERKLAGALARLYAEERSFVDIPGERLADFAMAGRSYAAWSDWLLDTIRRDKRYRVFFEDYLRLLASGSLDARGVVREYKSGLAQVAQRMLPLVCPSSFLVDHGMSYPRSGDPPAYDMSVDELATRGICGLDRSSEFAPLTAQARDANPQVAAAFGERYDEYNAKVSEPLAASFHHCDQLLVLVDVCAILAGGPEAYYGTRWSLKMMLDALEPGRTGVEWLRDYAKWILTAGRGGPSRIRKIGFIAPKADVVNSRDRVNLRTLLRSLTDDLLARAKVERHLDVAYFYCAAIEAAADSEYPAVKGWARRRSHLQYLEFRNSPVPREWPAESEWAQRQYAFAAPEPPKLDLLGRRPFPSIGMDEILRFIGCDHAAGEQ